VSDQVAHAAGDLPPGLADTVVSSRRQINDLELGRAEIAQGRVPPLAIIENLNVLENVAPGFVAGQVIAMMDQFGLQGMEKVLSAFGAKTQDVGLPRCSRHTSYCVLPRKLTEPVDERVHVCKGVPGGRRGLCGKNGGAHMRLWLLTTAADIASRSQRATPSSA
jgi:hypothetical protein